MPYPFTGANANPWQYSIQNQQIPVNQPSVAPSGENVTMLVWGTKQEAMNIPVRAGQSIFIMDRNIPRFYVKTVSQNGILLPLEEYEFTPVEQQVNPVQEEAKPIANNYVTKDEFNELKKMLEDLTAPSKKG